MISEDLLNELTEYFRTQSLDPRELYRALCNKFLDSEAGYEFIITHRESARLVANMVGCGYTDLYMSGGEGEVSLLLKTLFAKHHLTQR